MDILKFTLKGQTAFFKNPEVNSYVYYTFGNLHKVGLLGIMGAILGYGGYSSQKKAGKARGKVKSDTSSIADEYPEFYEKLKALPVSIVPHKPYFGKKVQVFNNSVGYASQEQGGNLIVKEQWLESVGWDVYFPIYDEITKALAERLKESRFEYIPYLGKNDHFADISEVKVLDNVFMPQCMEDIVVEGMWPTELFETKACSEDAIFWGNTDTFKYEEYLPVGLTSQTNQYVLSKMVFTNSRVSALKDVMVYEADGKNIVFF